MNRIIPVLALLFLLFLNLPVFSQEKLMQLNYREYFTPEGEQYRTVFVWNTKTGQSARYYYDAEAWHKSTVAFPANPVGDSPTEAGEIMMNYGEYYTPEGEQFRTVFAWNTKTGKAQRYYYDAEEWHQSTVEFPEKPVGEVSGKVGEVMMKYLEYYTPEGEQFRVVFVWNTRTGKVARYYYDAEAWHKSTIEFPANPLGEATGTTGEVMMNYREYYTPEGEQFRTVFVWNTKTGKSQRYYYDAETWHKSTVEFPSNPVGDSPTEVGEIMMNYSEYYTPEGEQFRTVFAWNTKTGKAARYYYDAEAWHRSTVEFPEKPTGEVSGKTGEVMMSYLEYYTPDAEQYRVVFTWNTVNKKVQRYYYDAEAWHKSTVAFPDNAVE